MAASNRHSAAQWRRAAPRAAGSCLKRCTHVVKGDAGGTRAGTLSSAYEYAQTGLKMQAGQMDGRNPAFLYSSTHSSSKRRISSTRAHVCDNTQGERNHPLRLMCTG